MNHEVLLAAAGARHAALTDPVDGAPTTANGDLHSPPVFCTYCWHPYSWRTGSAVVTTPSIDGSVGCWPDSPCSAAYSL